MSLVQRFFLEGFLLWLDELDQSCMRELSSCLRKVGLVQWCYVEGFLLKRDADNSKSWESIRCKLPVVNLGFRSGFVVFWGREPERSEFASFSHLVWVSLQRRGPAVYW